MDDLMVVKVAALTVAAEAGDARRVAELIGEGVPVDAVHEDPRYDNCGKTALEKAVQADQVTVVRLLLRVGADPEQPIGDDGTGGPLQFVARVGGRPEMAVALLEGGACPGGHRHRRGPAAIWSAAVAGDTALVELLLDHSAAINEENGGVSALAAAAAEGHSGTVRLMLRRGARDAVGALAAVKTSIRRLFENPARSGDSPARLAEFTQTRDLLEEAVARAAEGDPVDPFVEKVVALTVAAQAGDTRRVAELVGEGVPVDAAHEDPLCDNYRETALEKAVYADRVAVVRLLLSLGADPDQPIGQDHIDYALQFVARVGGRQEMAVALLEGGARPEGFPDRIGPTPIWLAAHAGNTALLEMLLDRGASPDEDYRGCGILEAAARNGHPDTVRFLLRRGAPGAAEALVAVKTGLRDHRDDPARQAALAETAGALEVAVASTIEDDPLLEKVVALTMAAEAGDARRVAELVSQGVPVDARHEDPRSENYRESALEKAVLAGHVATVRLLLSLGADPDQPIHDGRRRMDYPVIFFIAEGWRFLDSPLGYPLSYAAAVGSRHELAVALLEGGARPGGYPDRLRPTPIWSAAFAGNTTLVQMLLDRGADIDEGNMTSSPLAVAARHGHLETVRLMLRRGAQDVLEALTEAKSALRSTGRNPGTDADPAARRGKRAETMALLGAAFARTVAENLASTLAE